MALGRYDDALRHLREARGLAERPGGDWLLAASPVQLGILAVLRGRLDEARALIEEALDLGLAARSTPFVTLCLAAYARLALAEGDPERAARLKGAAEGLRQRVGLPGLAGSAAAGGGTGSPDPPGAERRPVRSGVLRRLRAHPTAGDRHRPGPARHRLPQVLSRHATARNPQHGARCENGPRAALLPTATRPARHRRPGCANPVAWALAWRYNPQTGTVILPGQNSLPLDPSLGTDSPPVSIFKAGFDCTIPVVGHPDRFAYAAATVSEPLTVAAVAVSSPADDAFEQCQDRSQAGSRLRWLHQVQLGCSRVGEQGGDPRLD